MTFGFYVFNKLTGKIVDCDTGLASLDEARKDAQYCVEHNKFMTGMEYTYKIIVED